MLLKNFAYANSTRQAPPKEHMKMAKEKEVCVNLLVFSIYYINNNVKVLLLLLLFLLLLFPRWKLLQPNRQP